MEILHQWEFWVTGATIIYIIGVFAGACIAHDNRLYRETADQWVYGILWPFVAFKSLFRSPVRFSKVFKDIWNG